MKKTLFLIFSIFLSLGVQGQQFRVLSQPGTYTEGINCFQMPDSGYIAIANTSGFNSFNQVYLLKLKIDGSFRADHAIPLSGSSRIRQAELTSTGLLMMAGIADDDQNYNGLFILSDTLGQVVQQSSYGGEDWESFSAVAEITSQGFCLGGYTYSQSAGGADAWILGINALGDSLWSIKYGSAGDDEIRDIASAPWGYLACGFSQADTASDVLLIAFDALGDTLWTRNWGSPSRDIALAVDICSDSGFVISGQTSGFGAIGNDGFLARFDKNGLHLWTQVFPGSKEDVLQDLLVIAGDSLAAAGTTTSFGAGREEFSLYLANPSGGFLGGGSYGGLSHDYFHSIAPSLDGGFILSGSSSSFGNAQQGMFIVKTNANGQSSITTQVVTSVSEIEKMPVHLPFPNPGRDQVTVAEGFETAIFYNIQGQRIAIHNLNQSNVLDITMLQAGIYLIELQGQNGSSLFKFVKSQ
jgi:hypothetical protein